ncbi:Cog5 [Symbiodinium natans]|uniref:Conserved oligomeric Golgi complex subunit 5 n=1 Tax=Symbiodinium natans TaxID=878477 RepID=A0A812M4H0_9DINO|nr:Cog5 [Symbiodinium natans]
MRASGGHNALLETFRKPDFNVAAFVKEATSGQEKALRLSQQLQDSASSLEEDLRREIASCHEELLLCAGSISDLEGQLGEASDIVGTLKSAVARVRTDMLAPFQEVKGNVELLERMQAVNVLVRKLLRFLFDARKLRSQMDAPGKDFSKAAHTLHELEAVLQESSLEKVDVLRAEVLWIRDVGAKVRRQSEEDLRTGVRQGNHIALSVALQVFFNLNCLWPQLKKLLAELLEEVRQAPLAAAGFLQGLEVNLQVLVAQTQRVHALEEIVQAKTDPVTHRSFQSVLEDAGVRSLTGHFWTEAASVFKAKLAKVCQDRTFRSKAIADCPKVLQSLVSAVDKLGRGKVMKSTEREILYQSATDLRNEFLGESIRRVTDPIEMMLPDKLLSSLSASGERIGGTGETVTDELPTMHDLRRYVQLLVTELERVECCPELLLKDVVRSVRSSVLFFATRLEQVVDSSSVIQCLTEEDGRLRLKAPLPMPTAGHARNARLFGIAHHTLVALRELIPSRFLESVATDQVQSTLKQAQAAVVTPLFTSLQSSLRRAVVAACLSNDEGQLGAVSQACSHLSRHFFSLFGAGQLQGHLREFCSFAMRCFLSAAALARAPLRQELATLETLLASLDPDYASHLRYEASVLKEFAKLLASASVESQDFEELANVIPLHLLLTFLLHRLKVPSLPEFLRQSPEQYLETAVQLWDEKPRALESFKANVANLSDKYNLDPTESPLVAFIIAQSSS